MEDDEGVVYDLGVFSNQSLPKIHGDAWIFENRTPFPSSQQDWVVEHDVWGETWMRRQRRPIPRVPQEFVHHGNGEERIATKQFPVHASNGEHAMDLGDGPLPVQQQKRKVPPERRVVECQCQWKVRVVR